MNAVDLMKCADLAAHLGHILGVNPVWEDEFVNYELADDLIELSFDLDNGCWTIATDEGAGDYGMVRLPKEAPELMAGMSELAMKSKQNGTTTIVLKDGKRIEVKEDAAVVNAKYNRADNLDTEELMAWMGSDGTRPFPDPHNRFKVTEKETGKEISLSAKQIQRIIVDETEDE